MNNDNWLNEAVEGASGNLPTFDEMIAELFEPLEKIKANGYPDDYILAILQDSCGQFKGAVLFGIWKKHLEDEAYAKAHGFHAH